MVIIKAIDRKLVRDLARMWAQAVTIGLVLACGVASFVAMRGAHASILQERDAYYADRRFADVFARVERAPESVAARLEAIDGIARVHTRIVENVLVPIEGETMPAVGQIVSLPSLWESPLNALRMRAGRMVESGHPDEVIVLESFADAHHLRPGARLDVVLEGKLRSLEVVGIAMSPEYVFAVGPGSFMNDPARFGVLWMNHDAVAAAYRMEASFNDVIVALQPGASEARVVAELREVLRPYGVMMANGRDRQISHHVLEGELLQLSSYAIVAPAIFLAVAAFLINVVMVRTLSLQRPQIATLKALGYRNVEIARHYLELVLLILVGGAVVGVAAGDLLGQGMISLYRPFFRFPDLAFKLDVATVATSLLISIGAGLAGASLAILRAIRIPPAEAMLPETPAVYRRPILEALGVPRLTGVAGRMVIRELMRRPLRALFSCVAIALATSTVISGRFADDSVTLLFDLVFERAQHDDIEVTFTRPVTAQVRSEIAALPGVVAAEGRRVVPVRVHADQNSRDVAIIGHELDAVSLRDVPQWPMHTFEAPLGGVVASKKLAEILGVGVGSEIDLEVLEGDRRTASVVVTGLVDDVFGLSLHASNETLRRLIDEQGNITSVMLVVERGSEDELLRRLALLPRASSIARRDEVVEKFHEQTRYMWITMMILTGMGATIAFGVVYNQARIALSTRSRDLASLRVLGFTRREISTILLGELAIYVIVGIPAGWLVGRWLVGLITSTVDPESYRMPTYVSSATYAFGALVTIGAAAISALVVRRRLDHLDLVSVLKARE